MKDIFIIMLLTIVALSTASAQTATKKQCTALTVKGVQCKKTATDGQNVCSIHSESRIRCGATTSAGKACRMAVKAAGDKCRFHAAKSTQ